MNAFINYSLGAILTVQNEKKAVRIKDITKKLSIGAASASKTVKKLTAKSFLNYLSYGIISLSERGKKITTKTLKTNKIHEKFLLKFRK